MPRTVQAPALSCFMVSMWPVGLRLMPPVSNVRPFPMIAIGFATFLVLYSMVTMYGPSLLPWPTERIAPAPIFSRRLRSRTVMRALISFASLRACVTIAFGPISFDVVLMRSRV